MNIEYAGTRQLKKEHFFMILESNLSTYSTKKKIRRSIQNIFKFWPGDKMFKFCVRYATPLVTSQLVVKLCDVKDEIIEDKSMEEVLRGIGRGEYLN